MDGWRGGDFYLLLLLLVALVLLAMCVCVGAACRDAMLARLLHALAAPL